MDVQSPTGGSDKIQLRIDDFSTRKINLFTAVVTLLIGVIFLLAISAPNAIVERDRSFAACDPAIYTQLGYSCDDAASSNNLYLNVRVTDKEVAPSNRFIVIQLQPLTLLKTDSSSVNAQVEVSAYLKSEKESKFVLNKQQQTLSFECSTSEGTCESEEAVILDHIERGNYYFVIKFLNTADVSSSVSNWEAHSYTWSLAYAVYKFIVKFLFLASTVAGYFWYTRSIKALKKTFHSREQKIIKFIIPVLITVNEPFTYHVLSGFMYVTMTSAQVFASSAVLLWLWMPFIDEIAGSESSVIDKSSKFSKFYVIAYGVTGLLTYIIYCNGAVKDPVHFFNSAPGGGYAFIKFLFLSVLLVGVAWIAWKSVSIIRRLDELTQRESTFFCFNSVFILCQFYLVARGGADPFSFDGTRVILYDGLTTLYVFAAAFLFIPTEEGVAQADHKQKYDNPVANAAYKDLDESDDKPRNRALGSGNYGTDLERGVSAASQASQPSSNDIDKKYPYESKGDDDL